MKAEPRVAFEPCCNSRMFVRAIVVDDKMQIQIRRSFDIDELQESNEFLMSMTGHTIANNLAIEHAESRK